MEWTYYCPALWRFAFWKRCGEILLKGALTGALLFGLLSVAGASYDKVTSQPSDKGFAGWLGTINGPDWVSFCAAFWAVGSLFYSARRIWNAERDNEVAEALRSISIPLGRRFRTDGYRVFAMSGGYLKTTEKVSQWQRMAHMDVAALADKRRWWRRKPRPSDMPSREEYLENKARICLVLEKAWEHDLVEMASPPEVLLEHKKCFITKKGPTEHARARRAYGLHA